MALLRVGVSVTDACMAVGCTSLGSFSSRFAEVVGETPRQGSGTMRHRQVLTFVLSVEIAEPGLAG